MIENNNVELLFEARSENEAFARVVAAAFVTYLDPTIAGHKNSSFRGSN